VIARNATVSWCTRDLARSESRQNDQRAALKRHHGHLDTVISLSWRHRCLPLLLQKFKLFREIWDHTYIAIAYCG